MKRVCTIIGLTPLLLLAGDFWQDKEPSDWTGKDVKRMLTKSPWAKDASVSGGMNEISGPRSMDASSAAGGGRRAGGGGGGGGITGGSPMGGGGGGRGGGGAEGPAMGGGMGGSDTPGGGGGGRTAPKVTVRWESATPEREAAVKEEYPYAKFVADWSRDFYVVTVSGLPMMGRHRSEGVAAQAAAALPTEVESRMKEVTSLQSKDKDPVAPARVVSL